MSENSFIKKKKFIAFEFSFNDLCVFRKHNAVCFYFNIKNFNSKILFFSKFSRGN